MENHQDDDTINIELIQKESGERNHNFNPRTNLPSKNQILAEYDFKHFSRSNSPPLEMPESDRELSSRSIIAQEKQEEKYEENKSASQKPSIIMKGQQTQNRLSDSGGYTSQFPSKPKILNISKTKKSQAISQAIQQQQDMPLINEEFKIKMQNLKIERFCYIWMNMVDCIRFKKFRQKQLNTIADKAACQMPETIDHHLLHGQVQTSIMQQRRLSRFQKIRDNILKSIQPPLQIIKTVWWDKVISPFNPLSIIMDALTVIIITIDVMMITWTTFYGLHLEFMAFEFFSFAHFVIFILSRFHIGFYNRGKICLDKSKITKRYLKNSFLLDFIGVNSLLIYLITQNQYIRIINFARIGALRESFRKIEYLLFNYGIASHTYTLFKLVLNIMIISHFLGVTYHLLNLLEIYLGEEESWLQINGFDQQTWLNQYAESVYWAVATLMLIGAKGDTLAETIFTTLILFFTVGIFGYLISSISEILDDINRKQKEYNNDFRIINRYMRNKGISNKIQTEVRTAIENMYNSKELVDDNGQAQQIIDKLPENVKDNIKLQINQEILERFPIFKMVFSENFLQKISTIMEEKTFVENETIFNEDSDKIYLYFLTSGSIKLQQTSQLCEKYKTFRVIKPFSLLGDVEFFTNQGYTYKAICSSFSTITKISLVEFMRILKEEQLDKEKYMMIRELMSHHGKTICQNQQQRKSYTVNQKKSLISLLIQTYYIQEHVYNVINTLIKNKIVARFILILRN